MTKLDKKKLMIEERKRAQRLHPEPAVVVQAMYFALATAKDHLESAEILLKANKVSTGFSLFVSALEEIGKISMLMNIAGSWARPDLSQTYIKLQKSHLTKISAFLEMFLKLRENKNLSFSTTFPNGNESDGKKFISSLIHNIQSNSAEHYHLLRQDLMYTSFSKNRVTGPHQYIEKLDKEYLLKATNLFKNTIAQIMKLGKESLPAYFNLLDQSFIEKDRKKGNNIKRELNRRLKRTLPAIRFYLDGFWKKKFGTDLFNEKKEDISVKLKGINMDLNLHVSRICRLIVSRKKIDQKYYYPPLKDEAEKYYSAFTK